MNDTKDEILNQLEHLEDLITDFFSKLEEDFLDEESYNQYNKSYLNIHNKFQMIHDLVYFLD